VQGVALKGATPTVAYKDELIDGLISAINIRFAAAQTKSEAEVIEATRLLNLKTWPRGIVNKGQYAAYSVLHLF